MGEFGLWIKVYWSREAIQRKTGEGKELEYNFEGDLGLERSMEVSEERNLMKKKKKENFGEKEESVKEKISFGLLIYQH